MRIVLFFLLGIGLTACALDTLGKVQSGLVGQKVDVVVDRLGPPDKEQSFKDKKFYTWRRHIQSSISLPQTTRTTGTVAGRPVTAKSTVWTDEPFNYDCDVHISTNQRGVIEKFSYEGNEAGCEYYARKLEIFAKSSSLP